MNQLRNQRKYNFTAEPWQRSGAEPSRSWSLSTLLLLIEGDAHRCSGSSGPHSAQLRKISAATHKTTNPGHTRKYTQQLSNLYFGENLKNINTETFIPHNNRRWGHFSISRKHKYFPSTYTSTLCHHGIINIIAADLTYANSGSHTVILPNKISRISS